MGERLGRRKSVFSGFLAAGAAFGLWPEPDARSKKVDDQIVTAQEGVENDGSEVATTQTPQLVLPGTLPKLRGMPDVAAALAPSEPKTDVVPEPAPVLPEQITELQNAIQKGVDAISRQLHGFLLQPILGNDTQCYTVIPDTTADVEQVDLTDFIRELLHDMRLIPQDKGFVLTETEYFEPSLVRPPDLAAAEINDRKEATRLLKAWLNQEQAVREAETFLEYLVAHHRERLHSLFKPLAIEKLDKKYGKKKDGRDEEKEKNTDVAQA